MEGRQIYRARKQYYYLGMPGQICHKLNRCLALSTASHQFEQFVQASNSIPTPRRKDNYCRFDLADTTSNTSGNL